MHMRILLINILLFGINGAVLAHAGILAPHDWHFWAVTACLGGVQINNYRRGR
jgi:hypothetical protein